MIKRDTYCRDGKKHYDKLFLAQHGVSDKCIGEARETTPALLNK